MILAVPDSNWPYIILMSLFVLVNIMSGVSGIAKNGIVTPGIFGKHLIKYNIVSSITLVPLMVTRKGKKRVLMFISTNTSQQGQLIFDCDSADNLKSNIDNILPHSITVTIKTMPPFGQ